MLYNTELQKCNSKDKVKETVFQNLFTPKFEEKLEALAQKVRDKTLDLESFIVEYSLITMSRLTRQELGEYLRHKEYVAFFDEFIPPLYAYNTETHAYRPIESWEVIASNETVIVGTPPDAEIAYPVE